MDVLFSPSVLYILVPLLVVMALTRLINTNDPELQKELQQMNRQQKLPDLSEVSFARFTFVTVFGYVVSGNNLLN